MLTILFVMLLIITVRLWGPFFMGAIVIILAIPVFIVTAILKLFKRT